MAEQLLLVPAQQIIETLGSLAANKIAFLWGVEDELQRLTDTVSIIKDLLLDAEEKEAAGDRVVRRWLGRLEVPCMMRMTCWMLFPLKLYGGKY